MIFLQLFWTFFKIGLFTFGGGYAMLPLIQSEVMAHEWMGMEELINFVAVSESTPGPFAVNISTYVGMETAGFLGAACATLGVITPSFVIILFIAHSYEKFKESHVIKGVMSGLKPAVVGMIGAAVLSVGKTTFQFTDIWELVISIGIFLLMIVLAFQKKHPILIVCLSAVFGILFGYLLEGLK